MLGAGQFLTPVKDTITLGDDHTQLPRWACRPVTPSRPTIGQQARRPTVMHAARHAHYPQSARASAKLGPTAAGSPFGGLIVQGGVTSGLLNAVVAEDLPGPGTVFLGVEWRFLKARRRRNHRPPLHRAAAGGRCRIAAASISRSHLPEEVICLEAHYCPLLAHCSPASRRVGCPPNSWGDAASRASARQAPSAGAPPAQPRQGGQRQAHQCQRCRLRRRNAGDREPADRYG